MNRDRINIQNEVWRDIQGYSGLYQVSSRGRIRRAQTKVVEYTDSGEVISERTKEPLYIDYVIRHQDGYPVCFLTKNGKTTQYRPYRLVAEAFLPQKEGQTVVHHIDRDVLNNAVDNLQWLTPEEHSNVHRRKYKRPRR